VKSTSFLFQDGPLLQDARSRHSCGIIRDANGTPQYVIVAGGRKHSKNKDAILNSVEYLDLNEITKGWQKSNQHLPFHVERSVLVEDQMTNSLIIIGGQSTNANHKLTSIYKLSDPLDSWEKQNYRLNHARVGHVAMFIPSSLVTCKN